MTAKHASTTVPNVLLIKLSTQQHHDFAECAKACGLDLVNWIVQCADVQAAAAIDAMQALQRVHRPDRKKQQPRQRVERTAAENPVAPGGDPVPRGAAAKNPGKHVAPPPAPAPSPGAPDSAKSSTQGTPQTVPAQAPVPKRASAKIEMMRAARAYNARFRRQLDENPRGPELRNEGVR
jgi:hypothetical protein